MGIIDSKLTITGWDENPYEEFDDGAKFTRAEVTLDPGPDGLGPGTSQSLMFYRPDGSSSFVSLMRLTGELDGKTGSFVLLGTGTYEDGTARVDSTVVPGSGTGDLTGISGTAESVSTSSDYPHMPLKLTYSLE